MLRRTVLGRNMYATGGNPEVARLVGINTDLYKIGAFILVGVLAAIAGMFVMADLASGTTSIGSGWELTVIAGVVVGGVSLFGGAGTMAGGLIGVLLLQVVQSGLVVIGVNSNWQQIAVGVIMVLAVGLDILRRRLFIAGGAARRGDAKQPNAGRGALRAPSPRQQSAGEGPAVSEGRNCKMTFRTKTRQPRRWSRRSPLAAEPASPGRRQASCCGCSRCATIRCTG